MVVGVTETDANDSDEDEDEDDSLQGSSYLFVIIVDVVFDNVKKAWTG